MKRNAVLASALGAMVAFGLIAQGCSSTSNGGGTGGASGVGGTTGVGGKLGGQGGTTGAGGRTGAGGSTSTDAGQDAGPQMCNPSPNEGATCTNNPPCNKNCGVNIMAISLSRAQKTCTCSGTWTCGTYTYPTDLDPACFHIPAPPPACPRDSVDGGTDAGADAGTAGLIKSGITPCTPPNSEVCGSLCGSAVAGTFSYQDSSNVAKVGYCVCIAGAWQCASVAEWPPQQ